MFTTTMFKQNFIHNFERNLVQPQPGQRHAQLRVVMLHQLFVALVSKGLVGAEEDEVVQVTGEESLEVYHHHVYTPILEWKKFWVRQKPILIPIKSQIVL